MISHPSALSGAIFIKGKPLIVPNIWLKPAVFPLILSPASIRNLQLLVVPNQTDPMKGKVCQDLQYISGMLCLPDPLLLNTCR